MKPVPLHSARLVLDQPMLADVDRVAEYCQDPLFRQFMVTPWPYRRADAEEFIGVLVPQWWETESEFTWALRLNGVLIGVIGYRTGGRDIGFWLGAPYRGNGYMPEAVAVILDWIFEQRDDDVVWECVIGNASSMAVARKTGFRFCGEGTAIFATRDGEHPIALQATIAKTDSREPKSGWPTA